MGRDRTDRTDGDSRRGLTTQPERDDPDGTTAEATVARTAVAEGTSTGSRPAVQPNGTYATPGQTTPTIEDVSHIDTPAEARSATSGETDGVAEAVDEHWTVVSSQPGSHLTVGTEDEETLGYQIETDPQGDRVVLLKGDLFSAETDLDGLPIQLRPETIEELDYQPSWAEAARRLETWIESRPSTTGWNDRPTEEVADWTDEV
jgi:hypothetical protein